MDGCVTHCASAQAEILLPGMTHLSIREAYSSSHEPESMRRLADVYWTIVVCIGTLLMLGSVGYGMWQFFVPPSRVESGATLGVRNEGFDKAELKKAVAALQQRRDEFEALLKK